MDALVKAALDKVNEAVTQAESEKQIVKALRAIDALRSALKTVTITEPPCVAEKPRLEEEEDIDGMRPRNRPK